VIQPPRIKRREPRVRAACSERALGARSVACICTAGSCHVDVVTSKYARSVSDT